MNGTFVRAAHAPWQYWVTLGRTPILIATLFLLLHVFLAFTVDAADPEAFLRADRAYERMQALQGLLASSSPQQAIEFLGAHGIVGDYAAHALLYVVGGRLAVVFVQIALVILSGIGVYRLAALLGLPPRARAAVMAIYLSLPHTLVFAHQLATEALHVPLFVISNWLLAEGIRNKRLSALAWSAACLGLATLIRPISLLWPIVAAAALMVSWRPRAGLLYACLAILPVLAWMSFVGAQTGSFGLGESSHSMTSNLYERVMRITATLPAKERRAARATYLQDSEHSIGPFAYMRFSLDYPQASLEHLLRDAVAFFAKSGVERITIDYLALSTRSAMLQDDQEGWRRQLELNGAAHTARYLWGALGAIFLASLLGALVIVTLFVFAILGAWTFAKRWREICTPEVATGLLLACVVIYTFVFSQVLNAMQSRQRAPAEFAIVLLGAAGLRSLRQRRSERIEWARATQSRNASTPRRAALRGTFFQTCESYLRSCGSGSTAGNGASSNK